MTTSNHIESLKIGQDEFLITVAWVRKIPHLIHSQHYTVLGFGIKFRLILQGVNLQVQPARKLMTTVFLVF